VVGVCSGILLGLFGGLLFKCCKNNKLVFWLKAVYCVALSFLFVIVSVQKFTVRGEKYSLSNMKYIACFCMGYTLNRLWGDDGVPLKETKMIFQTMMPGLFGSIGASLQIKLITPQSVAFSISHIILG
jgi:hypothetical protein